VLLGARNACRTGQVSFEIGFEGGVGVDRSKMRKEGITYGAYELLTCLTINTTVSTATFRDVRSQDMISVSRPKFEVLGLGLDLVPMVSVSSFMVSCLKVFRDLP